VQGLSKNKELNVKLKQDGTRQEKCFKRETLLAERRAGDAIPGDVMRADLHNTNLIF
jgi:hypothetical protein